MTVSLLIDESVDSSNLRRGLAAAAFHAEAAAHIGLSGAPDSQVFAHAQSHGLVVLTSNPSDFILLARRSPGHAGVLLVYKDNDRTRDMSDSEIVRAITNLLASGLPIAGEVHTLNHWRY